jgi:hypothetical protein
MEARESIVDDLKHRVDSFRQQARGVREKHNRLVIDKHSVNDVAIGLALIILSRPKRFARAPNTKDDFMLLETPPQHVEGWSVSRIEDRRTKLATLSATCEGEDGPFTAWHSEPSLFMKGASHFTSSVVGFPFLPDRAIIIDVLNDP